jgi:hypothetical protein
MTCFRLDIRLLSLLHVLIVINFNNQYIYIHWITQWFYMFYSVILYLSYLGTIFCDVLSLDVCLIFWLHVFVHIYSQSNYVSTGINHWLYKLYFILFYLFTQLLCFITLYWLIFTILTCSISHMYCRYMER